MVDNERIISAYHVADGQIHPYALLVSFLFFDQVHMKAITLHFPTQENL